MTVEPIDAYIAALEAALRGPRRARSDLLTETRDSLIDATEAYQHQGMERIAAERRAVREFGEVDVIAPQYQTELALAQGHRTAVITLFTLLAQPIVWNDAVLPVPASQHDPGPAYAVLSGLVEWFGGSAILGSVLAVLACGVGVRYLTARRPLARITGTFAVTVSAVLAVLGVALTAVNATPLPLFDSRGVIWLVVFLLAPLAWVAASGRRCLRMT